MTQEVLNLFKVDLSRAKNKRSFIVFSTTAESASQHILLRQEGWEIVRVIPIVRPSHFRVPFQH